MKLALLVIDVQNEYSAPHGKWVLPEGERGFVRARDTQTSLAALAAPVAVATVGE